MKNQKESQKKHYQQNKKQIRIQHKNYYQQNKEQILIRIKNYYQQNKEQILIRIKKYQQKNKEQIKIKGKKYRQENKIKIKIKSKKYRQKNKEQIAIKTKNYYQENQEKIKKYRQENQEQIKIKSKNYSQQNKPKRSKYLKKKRKNDKNYNITLRLRGIVRQAFRLYTKTGKIQSSSKYGINHKAIIQHLQPFPQDLSKYHIDHIQPLCSFTFINDDGSTNQEEIKKAFAPENHQWLLAYDNISKGGRWEGQ